MIYAHTHSSTLHNHKFLFKGELKDPLLVLSSKISSSRIFSQIYTTTRNTCKNPTKILHLIFISKMKYTYIPIYTSNDIKYIHTYILVYWGLGLCHLNYWRKGSWLGFCLYRGPSLLVCLHLVSLIFVFWFLVIS